MTFVKRCTTQRWYMTINVNATDCDDVNYRYLQEITSKANFGIQRTKAFGVKEKVVLSTVYYDVELSSSLPNVNKNVYVPASSVSCLGEYLEKDFGVYDHPFQRTGDLRVNHVASSNRDENDAEFLLGKDLYDAIFESI